MYQRIHKYAQLFSVFALGTILSLVLPVLFKDSSVAVLANSTAEATQSSSLNLLQTAFLGFVQGATEFLPISSSAHLKVVPLALGWGDPGVTYTAVIQLGSIVAELWYFREDLMQTAVGMFQAIQKKNYQSKDYQMGTGILLGTIPIILGGILIKIFIPDFDRSPLRSLSTIAIVSIVMASLLAVAEYIGTHKRSFEQLTIKDGIIMGSAQALALIPGVSRSGSTITAGLFMNLERSTAARFSFLLGIPSITLAGLVELKDAIEQGFAGSGWLTLVVGTISSAIFSYLAIAWLIKFLQRRSTWIFVWYRLVFGILILIAVGTGKL